MIDSHGFEINFIEPLDIRASIQLSVIESTLTRQRSGRVLYEVPARLLGLSRDRIRQIVRDASNRGPQLSYRVVPDDILKELAFRHHDISGICAAQ